ncbi:MAG: hypothetical protein DSZ24_01855 [Thermodesulfatator sp.]|nr:MAG: hypothetical protein DSZ24_01855 [Thermodesulfatator sp.]
MTPGFLLELLAILTTAWFLGYGAQRLGLPVMLGELTAGLLLGPTFLGLIHPSEALGILAELGIFFAMFYRGGRKVFGGRGRNQAFWLYLGRGPGARPSKGSALHPFREIPQPPKHRP